MTDAVGFLGQLAGSTAVCENVADLRAVFVILDGCGGAQLACVVFLRLGVLGAAGSLACAGRVLWLRGSS